ncbi:MAG: type I secretion system permease/ATPase [Marinosulfonomonas sp.]|nr:type I secretion system permease/ATPase [Marinosulfonomonas sp.]
MDSQTRAEPTLAFAQCRRWIATAFVFSIFTNILMLTGPLFMLQIYDRVLSSRSEETLVALFGLVAVLYIFYGLVEFARGRILARVGARFLTVLGPNVFRAMVRHAALKTPLLTGQHGARELDKIHAFLSGPIMLALLDLPWTPVFLAAIFIFHPGLGWLALGGGGVLFLVALANQWATKANTTDAQNLSFRSDSFGKQVMSGSEVIWAQGMVTAIVRRWQVGAQLALQQSMMAADKTGAFTAFTKAFRLFLQSAMLAAGAWLVLQGELTGGAMIAASIMLGRALAPVETAVSQWSVMQQAWGARRNLAKVLEQSGKEIAQTRLPLPAATLRADGVSVFGRGIEKPFLHNVSFDLKPGHALGVIGNSGSGKTTLARTLVGLARPATGEVRFGGATIAQYGPEQMAKLIGYLSQSVQFLEATVAENIAHMAQNPDSKLVVEAAKKAKVHEVILQLPQGYDTFLGPLDTQLSGGQIQRLGLARALFGNPRILILDEPTSALDAEGTDALNSVINDMKFRRKSVIVMTHRPTAILACDDLLMLQQGRVVAYGPREEVIRSVMKNSCEVAQVLQQKLAS